MLFTWLMLAGFIFLLAPQKLTNKFQFTFARIFRWPLGIGRNVSLSVHTNQPTTGLVSRSEYNRLQNHIANLTKWLEQEHKKVEKLAGLRNRAFLEGTRFVLADVITASIDGLHSELVINRGQNDGLAEGQFVLGDNSIIGTIFILSSRTAKVKLITDSTSIMAVKITGVNVEMLMQGNGDNTANIGLTKHKVKAGDKVYAAKKPGLLDAPIIVGTVDKCERNDENPLVWDVTVEPACELKRLNDVAVLIMNPQEN